MLLSVAVLLSCVGCQSDQPPKHNRIEMAFFQCEKCRSLEGGIYGKGPFKSLRSPDAKTCVHDWQAIDKAEFKKLGTEWKGVDWSKEIPFWNPQTNGIPNQKPDAMR